MTDLNAVLKQLEMMKGYTTFDVQKRYREMFGYSLSESSIRKTLKRLELEGNARHECQGRLWIWYLTSQGKKVVG
jgi:hypothetical protein